jgi:catechol 2,3-dioxygenase-like lactoylglutathione lyase family enzyme
LANQSGRPIAPARKLVAAVLGTIAVFVMVFGLGLSSWAIVVLGLAVLALSIALGMVNVVRRGARAWVSGTAQVKAISDPPTSSAYGRAELQVVVVAPGLPVTEVLIRDPRVPVEKWPRLGETLPITVDVDDMRRVRIDWTNAPDIADPPPPGGSYAEPAFTDPLDEYDDDLLGEPTPPPWNPGLQWSDDPDEPPPPPPPAGVPAQPGPSEAELRPGPVVVRDTPGGPILEGQFVDHDDSPPPLPRRAASGAGPIPAPAGPPDPPRPAGTRPSPRPRSGAPAGAATATVDPETAQIHHDGTSFPAPEAAPTPAATAQTTAPEQRPAPDTASAPSQPAPVDDPDLGAAASVPGDDHEIDLPLDGDPEPAPEYSPAARSAMAAGLVAPPPEDIPHFVPPQRDETATDPPTVAAQSETETDTETGTETPAGPWADLGAAAYQPGNHTDEVITAYPSARPGAAGAIHGVGLTVLVEDLARSVRFYRDTLGFFEIDKGEGNAVLASGDTRLVLRRVNDLSSAGRLVYLNLEVGDVEAVYRDLLSKGVVFEHEPMVVNHGDRLELWSATFHDPDGHNIAITQWRATQ